jgi:hypothetical protein
MIAANDIDRDAVPTGSGNDTEPCLNVLRTTQALAPISIIRPVFLDQPVKQPSVGLDRLCALEVAELDMIVEEVEFDPKAYKREGHHDRVVSKML